MKLVFLSIFEIEKIAENYINNKEIIDEISKYLPISNISNVERLIKQAAKEIKI